jgi:tetratricopeptide (TPR) repeat protein
MDKTAVRDGLQRVVEIYSDWSSGGGSIGSGYVVGPDLVLTAAHTVERKGSRCQVRPVGTSKWLEAEVVWPRRPTPGVDAALVRVQGEPWADMPERSPVRWAVPLGDGIPCLARGFPDAQERPDQVRDTERMTGRLDTTASFKAQRHSVNVLTPALRSRDPQAIGDDEETSWWRGMSGAAMLADIPGRPILGVVAWDKTRAYGAGRLDAVPAATLLADEQFAGLVGASSGDIEQVTPDRPPVAIHKLLDDPYSPLPDGAPDWWLLLSRYGVVPFQDRDAELDRLRQWCATAPLLDIAVITGDGGAGKTRLAAELCMAMDAQNWDVGLVPMKRLAEQLAADGQAAGLDGSLPALLVLDYPEPSVQLIGQLIIQLSQRRRGSPIRLLLLARESGQSASSTGPRPDEWWTQLDRATSGYLSGHRRLIIRLNTHRLTAESRQRQFAAAVRAFAAPGAILPTPPPLQDAIFGHPLWIHMAALLALRTGNPDSAHNVLQQFLNRERHHWLLSWPSRREQADLTVALVTLTTPTPDELQELLTVLPEVSEAARGSVVAWARKQFPGESRLAALGPDLVAEQLLGELGELADDGALASLVLSIYDCPARSTTHVVRMLDILQLSAGRPAVLAAMRELVLRRLTSLIAEAEANTESALGDLLTKSVTLLSADEATALELAQTAAQIPDTSAEAVGLRALRATLGGLTVDWRRRTGDSPALASALADQSAWLFQAADIPAAVAAADEALGICRELAQRLPGAHPDIYARASYNSAAAHLFSAEAPKALTPAWEASSRLDIIGTSAPEHAALEARANLVQCLSDLGRFTEAVTAFQPLASPELVQALHGLAMIVPSRVPAEPMASTLVRPPRTAVGWRPPETGYALRLGAEMALLLLRDLGDTWTDDPIVPLALVRLGNQLAAGGDDAPAASLLEEAVARMLLLRRFLPSAQQLIAGTSGTLGMIYSDLGHKAEALKFAQLSATHFQVLAEQDPASFRADAAGLLAHVGALQFELGHPDTAIAPLRQAALQLDREGSSDPQQQGWTHFMLGSCLVVLGQVRAGVTELESAADLLREVADNDPDAETAYVQSLLELGAAHRMLGEDAGPFFTEAAAIQRARNTDPVQLTAGMLGAFSAASLPEQVARAEASVAELRAVVQQPGEPSPWVQYSYIGALLSLAGLRFQSGLPADALALAMKAAEIAEAGQIQNPAQRVRVLVAVDAMIGRCLVELNRGAEAEPKLRGALAALEGQAESLPGLRQDLAFVLIALAQGLASTQQLTEAVVIAERAVELIRELRQPVFQVLSMDILATLMQQADQGERAGGILEEALTLVPLAPETDVLRAWTMELLGLWLHDTQSPDLDRIRHLVADGGALIEQAIARAMPVGPAQLHAHRAATAVLAITDIRLGTNPQSAAQILARLFQVSDLDAVAPTIAGTLSEISDMIGTDLLKSAEDLEAIASLLIYLASRVHPEGHTSGPAAALAGAMTVMTAAWDEMNLPERAIEFGQAAIRFLRPLNLSDPAAYRYQLGLVLRIVASGQTDSGHYTEALDDADQAIEVMRDPQDEDDRRSLGLALNERGRALTALDRTLEGMAAFAQALSVAPTLADAQFWARAKLSHRMWADNRPELAVDIARAATAQIEATPGLVSAPIAAMNHQCLGQAYELSGELDMAAGELRRASELYDADGPGALDLAAASDCNVRLSEVLVDLSCDDEALKFAQHAADLGRAVPADMDAPDDILVPALEQLAVCHIVLQHPREADAAYDEILEITQGGPPSELTRLMTVTNAVMDSADRRADVTLARAEYALALVGQIEPPTGEVGRYRAAAMIAKGEALLKLDRNDEAITVMKEAVALCRKDQPGSRLLGGLLSLLGDFYGGFGDFAAALPALREAADILRSIYQADPEDSGIALRFTLEKLQMVYDRLGQTAEAQSLAEEAASLRADLPEEA